MILTKTFTASGTDAKNVAAAINEQIKDYLIGTNLFKLTSVERRNGDRPKYIVKHVNSDYTLAFQSSTYTNFAYCNMALTRGSLGQITKDISYGSTAAGKISIHIVTNGYSFVLKIFNYNGDVVLGGSCLRYTKFSGEQGYMYNTNETNSWLGYMGRYTIGDDNSTIYQISHTALWSTEHAIFQERPTLEVSGKVVGYADDIVVINASHLADSNAFSIYHFNDEEYHGGRVIMNSYTSLSSCASTYAAATIKNT